MTSSVVQSDLVQSEMTHSPYKTQYFADLNKLRDQYGVVSQFCGEDKCDGTGDVFGYEEIRCVRCYGPKGSTCERNFESLGTETCPTGVCRTKVS